ncbi:hypothetical protein [Clostridium estertheticum]|uniref:hypothetical protein n=1 Tax=Clostridium estertheticum TaxID=238834 RepID=UPI001CF3BD35|nr:hypothetical protein [Clostridium estertheticum]MCB2341635.1 hypothetical protein [Clostridium estertheticum]
MSVKLYELKKVIFSPVVIGLMAVFIAFNIFVIFNQTQSTSELKVLNKIVDKFGYKINDKMMVDFKLYYSDQLKNLNEITFEKTSKTYKSAMDLFSNDFNSSNIYKEDDLEFFNDVRVIENYYYTAKNLDISYKDNNIKQVGEGGISMYNISGSAADTVRMQYAKLSIRFNKIKENGEYKNLFFIGNVYKMHTFLFKTLFRDFIFEIMILIVLITGYLMNYEFENKTLFVVYATKRGRKLNKDKFYVSILTSILVTTIIIGISLGIYFIVVSYSGLWKVPISSGFNWDNQLPYISWFNMSFIKYLFCCIGLVYVCEILFACITFIISNFIRSSYIVFFIFAITFGIAIIISGLIPVDSNAVFIGQFTPFVLILHSQQWFMEKGPFATFKYYEVFTIVAWSIILLSICGICMRKFRKQNLY